ncbi:MAG: hypothetical protein WCV56_04370 [Candidatus Omnitrophota bacterium]
MRKRHIVLWFFFMAFFVRPGEISADVGVNIVVVNPSESKTQKMTINYELPPGLQRSDILETGDLNAEYNVSRALFYVTGEIELNPKETRTVKVVIRDIWNIPSEKFDNISSILEGKIKGLQDSADPETLKLASDELRSRLEDVRKYQRDNAGDVQKRMEMYTSNMDKLRRIENDIFSLERMLSKETGTEERDETVLLTIEASNPRDEERTLPVKFELPREIIPQHIEELGGMEIMYDSAKDMFYLFAERTFAPEETRRFQVRIKNIWKISELEINRYVEEAEEAYAKFEGLSDEPTVAILLESIKNNASTIIETQKAAESVRDRVAVFRANQKLLRDIKDDLEKMKTLTIPEIDKEKQELSDVLRSEHIFETLRELSYKLFKEKLTASTVWRIIMLIVSFAIILTAVFYAIWIVKVKRNESRVYDKVK